MGLRSLEKPVEKKRFIIQQQSYRASECHWAVGEIPHSCGAPKTLCCNSAGAQHRLNLSPEY